MGFEDLDPGFEDLDPPYAQFPTAGIGAVGLSQAEEAEPVLSLILPGASEAA